MTLRGSADWKNVEEFLGGFKPGNARNVIEMLSCIARSVQLVGPEPSGSKR